MAAKGDVWFLKNLAGSGTPQFIECEADEELERGDLVSIGTTTGGKVEKVDNGDAQVFGLAMQDADDGDTLLVLPCYPWIEFGGTMDTLADQGDLVGVHIEADAIQFSETQNGGTASDPTHAVVLEIIDTSDKTVGVVFPKALTQEEVSTINNS